jgi:hypothetical protein
VLIVSGLTLVTTGCASSPDHRPVSAAAVDFVSAVADGNGAAACRVLTSDAQQSVSGATDVPCSKAVVSVDEKGTSVSSVQVWGDAAQVHVGQDVVFLRRVSGRWLVSAAGCVRQPAGPYDCDVGA